jgi:hypothetical protein
VVGASLSARGVDPVWLPLCAEGDAEAHSVRGHRLHCEGKASLKDTREGVSPICLGIEKALSVRTPFSCRNVFDMQSERGQAASDFDDASDVPFTACPNASWSASIHWSEVRRDVSLWMMTVALYRV